MTAKATRNADRIRIVHFANWYVKRIKMVKIRPLRRKDVAVVGDRLSRKSTERTFKLGRTCDISLCNRRVERKGRLRMIVAISQSAFATSR